MRDLPPASLGLRQARLFRTLDTPQLEQLARECTWRRFAPGQAVFGREAGSRDIHIIVAGRVRVTIYTASGRQVMFRDLAEGDSVGELAAIDGNGRSAHVVALTEVVTASMSPAQFHNLLASQPNVAANVLTNLVQLIRLLSDRVVEFSTLGVQNRIHADLLRLAREAGGCDNEALIVPAPRHAEIASRASTTREQVTRELSALARRVLIVKKGNALLVCDVAMLQRIVDDANSQA